MRRLAAAVLAAVALAAPARAESIRCDGGLVSVGDTKLDLLAKCGAPALVDPMTQERGAVRGSPTDSVAYTRRIVSTVEIWSYDFGPQRFTYLVTLEGGRVIGIERGSYGHAGATQLAPPPLPVSPCDSEAFTVGITKLERLSRCGEPAARDLRTEIRTLDAVVPGGVVGGTVAVDQEIWTYNLGSSRFVVVATLEAGKLVRVDRGSYGYGSR